MKYKKVVHTILLVSGLSVSSGVFADEMASPTMLANNCIGCHGTGGSSTGPATPSIAGVSEDTFIEAMKGYKSGDRPATIMGRIAKGYSDEEIEAMAGYFSQQTFVRYAQNHDAAKAANGEKLHKKYCEKCHVDGGIKDEDGSSILAGQWIPYLEYSVADFRAGNRDMTKKMKKRMEAMVKEQGEESLDDIIQFYGSHQ